MVKKETAPMTLIEGCPLRPSQLATAQTWSELTNLQADTLALDDGGGQDGNDVLRELGNVLCHTDEHTRGHSGG